MPSKDLTDDHNECDDPDKHDDHDDCDDNEDEDKDDDGYLAMKFI